MIAAREPVQRPADAQLLVVEEGSIEHWSRSALVELLRPGDLVVANDAATLPASLVLLALHGLHNLLLERSQAFGDGAGRLDRRLGRDPAGEGACKKSPGAA